MVARRHALLNLSTLLRHAPGAEDEVEASGELLLDEAPLSSDVVRVEGPLGWEVRVTNTGGDDDFIVTGRVSGSAVMECRRCLTEVSTGVDSSFVYPMVRRPSNEGPLEMVEDEDEEETLVFGHPEVDFAPLLAQLFAIDLPLTVLCREDCRGLSDEGVNLNEHPEAESTTRREDRQSPFDALKDIEL